MVRVNRFDERRDVLSPVCDRRSGAGAGRRSNDTNVND